MGMIDDLSLSSLRIELKHDAESLGFATGFISKRLNRWYLITNWHVLSGRNNETDKAMHRTAALPNKITIFLHVGKNSEPKNINWQPYTFSLYEDDDMEKPLWFNHPDGQGIDVVALPLTLESNIQIYSLDLVLAATKLVSRPAMPVSIIGFPFGLFGGRYFPIWVTGFIASEPDEDADGKPLFYVNADGESGLSGAPVVLRTTGFAEVTLGNLEFSGIKTKLLGIYSGRVRKDSKLCRVWKPKVIEELLSTLS